MATLAGLALLLVEDDADSREMLALFLAEEGAGVSTASSAAEARSALQHRLPDCILTDITLPDEDGFSFVATLRANPRTRHIPAIALTGHTDARFQSRALEVGFQRLVGKPLDILALPAVIAGVIDAARRMHGASTPHL